MNLFRAFHELTKIAVRANGGKPSEYNHTATWQCARNAVRMQDDMGRLMREHQKHAKLRVAIAAAKMVYAMRSAAVR